MGAACLCDQTAVLDGAEARRYATEHVDKVKVDAVAWTTTYRCRETGSTWLLDYPHSEGQGGGPPRLRRLTEPDPSI
jgi:hypothetical protein